MWGEERERETQRETDLFKELIHTVVDAWQVQNLLSRRARGLEKNCSSSPAAVSWQNSFFFFLLR